MLESNCTMSAMWRNMRFINKLYDKHKGQAIWICGSGPTLDDYPDNFLDDKIGITLHLATLKYPQASYRYFNEYDRLEYLIKQDPTVLERKNIFGWPFYRRTEEESARLTEKATKAYYLKLTPYPPNGMAKDIFTEVGVSAMKKQVKDAKRARVIKFGGYGTCAHGCLYTAIMMGGNPIFMIGCGFKSIGDKEHFNEANIIDKKMRPKIALFSDQSRTKRMFTGTKAIIEGCKEQGIKIHWCKNYEQTCRFH